MPRLFAAAAVLLLAGCVPDRPSRPIDDRTPPSDPTPTRMVLTFSKLPTDTDANGYPDTLVVRMHLFESEGGWPLPVGAHGKMRFDLLSPQAKQPLAVWEFDEDQTAKVAVRDAAGVAFIFDLSLLEAGRSDRFDVETVDLRGTFTAAKTPDRPIRQAISTHFGRTR